MVALTFWYVNRQPPIQKLSLDGRLISLKTKKGQVLRETAEGQDDLRALQKVFVTQQKGSFCGVASSCMALNALGIKTHGKGWTQGNLFEHKPSGVSYWKVLLTGMTLAQLGKLLEARGAKATPYYAEKHNRQAFKRIGRTLLKSKDTILLVNYDRRLLNQKGAGHISPIGGYHLRSDRWLVLDVSSYKYPPVWVPSKLLWEAMKSKDGESKRSRGWLAVTKGR